MIFTNIFQQLKSDSRLLYFRLWANCILVNGYYRSVIYDIQRERILPLSKLFCDTFSRCRRNSINEIYADISNPNITGFLKIIDYLIDNDYGILVDDPATFPALSRDFESPFAITNSIVEADSNSPELMYLSIKRLVNTRIQALRIDDVGAMTLTVLEKIDDLTKQSTIEQIYIRTHFASYSEQPDCQLSSRFRQIIYYNSPQDVVIERKNNSRIDIKYYSKSIGYKNCGYIKKDFFICNLPFFTESQRHNTCLNRKVCIDAEGNIKNCPAMAKSFGNIRDTSLKEAIEKPGFKDLWYICKDQIDVCKDCEFRYMCIDCRCFIKDPNNIHSQPAKCPYNPYICLWEGQEGYVPVEGCGTYSRETGFVPDKKRIKELNKRIWGKE